mgnify:CR=1 FL=1
MSTAAEVRERVQSALSGAPKTFTQVWLALGGTNDIWNATSRALQSLRRAGLIEHRRVGRLIYWSVTKP